ncbi:peroxiredoxin [Tenuifilaceae bacterium CYCD]|nr:peroxiredoxin [Tenuifilaceae bacterium CYCD]
MDKVQIFADWQEGMAFEAEVNGHKLMLDADEKVGGTNKGPRPKPLMLVALAGCTGMDVISILKKMKVDVINFRVWVEAEQTEEHPKHYSTMKVIYEFWGKNLPLENINKAISLSEEKYCGVSAAYRKGMTITHEVRINEE